MYLRQNTLVFKIAISYKIYIKFKQFSKYSYIKKQWNFVHKFRYHSKSFIQIFKHLRFIYFWIVYWKWRSILHWNWFNRNFIYSNLFKYCNLSTNDLICKSPCNFYKCLQIESRKNFVCVVKGSSILGDSKSNSKSTIVSLIQNPP